MGVSIPPERRQFHGAENSASPLIATRWADAEGGRPVNTAHAQGYEETTVIKASKVLNVGERGIRYAKIVLEEGTEDEIADCDSAKASPQTTAKKIRLSNYRTPSQGPRTRKAPARCQGQLNHDNRRKPK